jgi:hypothetical protein
MTGQQLEKFLSAHNLDRPKLYGHLGMSRQLFGNLLKRKSIDSTTLQHIADFAKVPLSEMLEERIKPPAPPAKTPGILNDPGVEYGKPKISNTDLINETKKIFRENTALLQTIIDRNTFIDKLLNA